MVKPKDLRLPFPWKERRILIQNKVWFVPPRPLPSSFIFPGWSDPELFDTPQPVRIEYCSGNGDWIVQRAKADPQSNWLAVELRLDRVKKIWSKAANNGVTNLSIVWAEAFELTRQFIPEASVHEVFVNFPDPWPKRKHAKHRIIRSDFVRELARCLVPSGRVVLVTDDEPYASQMVSEMTSSPHFESLLPAPFFQEAPKEYGTSFFESLFRSQEKMIRQLLFLKRP